MLNDPKILQAGKDAIIVIQTALDYTLKVSRKIKQHQRSFLLNSSIRSKEQIKNVMNSRYYKVKYKLPNGRIQVSDTEYSTDNPFLLIKDIVDKFVREVEILTREIEYVGNPSMNPINDALQTENLGLRTRLNILQANNLLRQECNKQMQEKITKLESTVERLRKELDELANKTSNKELEIGRLTTTVNQLTDSNVDMGADLTQAQNALSTLQTELAQAQKNKNDAVASLATLQTEFAQSQELLTTTEGALKQSQAKLSQVQTDLINLQAVSTTTQKKSIESNTLLTTTKEKITKLEENKNQLNQEIRMLTDKSTTDRAELNQLSALLIATKVKLNDSQALLTTARADKDTMHKSLSLTQAELNHALLQLSEARKALKNNQDQIFKLNKEKISLQEISEQMQLDQKDLYQKMKESKKTHNIYISNADEKINNLINENETLNKSLADFKNSFNKNDQLIAMSNENINKLKQQHLAMRENAEKNREKINILQKKIVAFEQLQSLSESDIGSNNALQIQIKKLNHSNTELRMEIENLKEQYDASIKQSEIQKDQILEYEEELVNCLDNEAELDGQIAVLMTKIKELTIQIKKVKEDKNSYIKNSEDELNAKSLLITNQQDNLSKLNKKIIELTSSIKNLTTANVKLTNDNIRLEQSKKEYVNVLKDKINVLEKDKKNLLAKMKELDDSLDNVKSEKRKLDRDYIRGKAKWVTSKALLDIISTKIQTTDIDPEDSNKEFKRFQLEIDSFLTAAEDLEKNLKNRIEDGVEELPSHKNLKDQILLDAKNNRDNLITGGSDTSVNIVLPILFTLLRISIYAVVICVIILLLIYIVQFINNQYQINKSYNTHRMSLNNNMEYINCT